ncbi:MAG: 2-amino-4-hydroxy-6-hydroxymethyldihydropteridine diphosphokinase [Bacteroidales bacterium]|nr:2-amino-4-hydroxy-6-hydroxymethyldihydropteridine diphosphokinase [Bacteroidales bacterium]
MNRVVLLAGGNQGDRRALMTQATGLLTRRVGRLVALSSLHETEPWGDFAEERPPLFLNRAIVLDTGLPPEGVLLEAQRIEALLGRRRVSGAAGYTSRTMDLDIIFYNDMVADMPGLVLPHPRMHLRRFVLEPLCEVMPGYRHPLLGLTMDELLAGLG